MIFQDVIVVHTEQRTDDSIEPEDSDADPQGFQERLKKVMPEINELVSKNIKKLRKKLGPFNFDEFDSPAYASVCEGNGITEGIVEIPDPESAEIEYFFGQKA